MESTETQVGLAGPQGAEGPPGPRGLQGAVGPMGVRGEKGEKGEPGIVGLTGATGPRGLQGLPGAKGDPGIQGPRGEKGDGFRLKGTVAAALNLPGSGNAIGDIWIAADSGRGWVWDQTEVWRDIGTLRGSRGEKGEVGAIGAQGVRGERGEIGPVGSAGPRGLQGLRGETGAQGVMGRTGATGMQGFPGKNGGVGPAGPRGERGERGATGLQGLRGERGEQGLVGPQGAEGRPGARGEKGETGEQGIQGLKGEPGPVGQQGGVGPIGLTGLRGEQGIRGERGPTGLPGPTGPIGEGIPDVPADNHPYVRARTMWLPLALPLPQGRLSLGNTPAQDAVNAAEIYYAPHSGNCITIFDGSAFRVRRFVMLKLQLNAVDHELDKNYDLFVFDRSNVLTLGTGPAWADLNTRTAKLIHRESLWLNAETMVVRCGVDAIVPANCAMYVGTVHVGPEAGKATMQFAPRSIRGGSSNILGLWNAYNRVKVSSRNIDATPTWSEDSMFARPVNGSVGNRISWVDGLGESQVWANLMHTAAGGPGALALCSIKMDGVTAHGEIQARFGVGTTALSAYVADRFVGQGSHFIQAMEQVFVGPPMRYFGGGAEALTIELEM